MESDAFPSPVEFGDSPFSFFVFSKLNQGYLYHYEENSAKIPANFPKKFGTAVQIPLRLRPQGTKSRRPSTVLSVKQGCWKFPLSKWT